MAWTTAPLHACLWCAQLFPKCLKIFDLSCQLAKPQPKQQEVFRYSAGSLAGNLARKGGERESMASALAANEYKVIIIGGLGVGKTSLLLRFVHDTFEDRVSRFVAEEKKAVIVDGQEVVLDIWDTAG